MNNDTVVILKTGLLNDEQLVSEALHQALDSSTTIDISIAASSDFTDSSWDDIINSLLSSSKVITV